jgi:hypothetical protein
MNLEIDIPEDLHPVKEHINLIHTQDGGLFSEVGFNATVDGELVKKRWPVNGGAKKAIETFTDKVFPHLRELFLEDLETVKAEQVAMAVVQEKKDKRAARRKKKAEDESGVSNEK